MVQRWGLERVGFLTLTTPDECTPKEISRRFHSLATRVLSATFRDYISVLERSPKGRLHFHLLVATREDIRSGVDFEAFGRGDYRSAPPALRSHWKQLRSLLGGYKFGRHELLPIRSSTDAISSYVGKYIAKHMDQRLEGDKGVRLVRYSAGARVASVRFSWNSPGAKFWRRVVGDLAKQIGADSLADITAEFGPKWAYGLRDVLFTVPAPVVETPRKPVWNPRAGEPLPPFQSQQQQRLAALRALGKAKGDASRRNQFRTLYRAIAAIQARRDREVEWERRKEAENAL